MMIQKMKSIPVCKNSIWHRSHYFPFLDRRSQDDNMDEEYLELRAIDASKATNLGITIFYPSRHS